MRNWIRVLLIGLCLVVPFVLLNCSLDDDSGPTDPGGGNGNNPPPDGGGGGEYQFSMEADPPSLEASGNDISEITAAITRTDNGQPITNGAYVTFRTTLGRLNFDGSTSGASMITVAAFEGEAMVYLVSEPTVGTALVTAAVGESQGSISVPFTNPGDNSVLILTMGNSPVQADVFGYGGTITEPLVETVFLFVGQDDDGNNQYEEAEIIVGCRYTCEDDIVVELEDSAFVTNTVNATDNPDDYITLIEFKVDYYINETQISLFSHLGPLTEIVYPGQTQEIFYILASVNELTDRARFPLFDLRTPQTAAIQTETVCTNPGDGTQYVCSTGIWVNCDWCWHPNSEGGELETRMMLTIRGINTSGQQFTASGEQVVNFADWAGDPTGTPN